MRPDMQMLGFMSPFAADTPSVAGSDPFDEAAPEAVAHVPKQTERVAFTAPTDALGISGDADFFGDAAAAPENAASPFRSFYSPVSGSDDLDIGDVASDDKDRRHAALDKARLGYQMRSREMLRNMQESLEVAESSSDL